MERKDISDDLLKVFNSLLGVKHDIDEKLLNNSTIQTHEGTFNKTILKTVINEFKNKNEIALNPDSTKYLGGLIANEYLQEFNGGNLNW